MAASIVLRPSPTVPVPSESLRAMSTLLTPLLGDRAARRAEERNRAERQRGFTIAPIRSNSSDMGAPGLPLAHGGRGAARKARVSWLAPGSGSAGDGLG